MKQNSMYLNIIGALMLATPLGNLMYAQSPEEKPKVEVRNVHRDLAMASNNDLKVETGKSRIETDGDLSEKDIRKARKQARKEERKERREERRARWQESNPDDWANAGYHYSYYLYGHGGSYYYGYGYGYPYRYGSLYRYQQYYRYRPYYRRHHPRGHHGG